MKVRSLPSWAGTARMVYGVCRRAIRDEHLAEDAFQAVFLVLANHPTRAIRAYRSGRLALRHRPARCSPPGGGKSAMRNDNDRLQNAPSSGRSADFDDLLRVLDEELSRCPTNSAPLVATFLEERTFDEAAKQLGWSVSTLRRRLDRAKELLRARLIGRERHALGGFVRRLPRAVRASNRPHAIDRCGRYWKLTVRDCDFARGRSHARFDDPQDGIGRDRDVAWTGGRIGSRRGNGTRSIGDNPTRSESERRRACAFRCAMSKASGRRFAAR